MIAAIQYVMDHSPARNAQRLVLLVIAEAADKHGVCWQSQDRIAHRAGVTRGVANTAVRGLQEAGLIEVRKIQRSRRRGNAYRIVMPGLEPVDEETWGLDDRIPHVTVSEIRTSSPPPTMSEIRTPRPYKGLEPSLGPSALSDEQALVPVAQAVPKLVKVDGQNLGLNALCEECGISTKGNQVGRAVAALNGGKAIKIGIRELIWLERVALEAAWQGEPGHFDPLVFENLVAERIREQAALYRKTMKGAMLTPTALATWWTDLGNADGRYDVNEHLRAIRERSAR